MSSHVTVVESRTRQFARMLANGNGISWICETLKISLSAGYRIANSELLQRAVEELQGEMDGEYAIANAEVMISDPVRDQVRSELWPKHFENLRDAMVDEESSMEQRLKAGDRVVDLMRKGQVGESTKGNNVLVNAAPIININPETLDEFRSIAASSRRAGELATSTAAKSGN